MQFTTVLAVFLASFAVATPVNDAVQLEKDAALQLERANALAERQDAMGVVTYISYDALKRNTVSCSHRGDSYKNCYAGATPGGQANEWTRGCSVATRCARSL